MLETTNSSRIGGPNKYPRGFKAFGMMSATWFPIIKTTFETSFDNHRSPFPYKGRSFLFAITQPRSIVV